MHGRVWSEITIVEVGIISQDRKVEEVCDLLADELRLIHKVGVIPYFLDGMALSGAPLEGIGCGKVYPCSVLCAE